MPEWREMTKQMTGLLLRRSEVLRSLRHYLRAQSQTSQHRSPGGERRWKRKRYTIFLERTREGHRQSGEHWNRFKGTVGETSERRGRAHMDFSERIDTILNWTKLPSGKRQIFRFVNLTRASCYKGWVVCFQPVDRPNVVNVCRHTIYACGTILCDCCGYLY